MIKAEEVILKDMQSLFCRSCRWKRECQIVIDRSTTTMDELDVLMEAPAEVYGNQEHLIQLERRLTFEVQSTLGITCNVKLVCPREIVRSEGKAIRVVDKRKL